MAHRDSTPSRWSTESGWRSLRPAAGSAATGSSLRALDDSTAQRGAWDPGKTTENAHVAITDLSTIAYIGDFNSGASAVSIPLLNRVGIPQISPTNTAVGLTAADAGAAPGEPAKYYPTGIRTYARVVPNDAVQARVQVELQKSLGCRRPYVVDDGEVDGEDLALSYQLAARSQGLHVLGVQAFQRRATDYTRARAQHRADGRGLRADQRADGVGRAAGGQADRRCDAAGADLRLGRGGGEHVRRPEPRRDPADDRPSRGADDAGRRAVRRATDGQAVLRGLPAPLRAGAARRDLRVRGDEARARLDLAGQRRRCRDSPPLQGARRRCSTPPVGRACSADTASPRTETRRCAVTASTECRTDGWCGGRVSTVDTTRRWLSASLSFR